MTSKLYKAEIEVVSTRVYWIRAVDGLAAMDKITELQKTTKPNELGVEIDSRFGSVYVPEEGQ